MRWRSITLGFGLLLGCWLSQPSIVRAHAELERAEPIAGALLDAPPDQVRIWFTEAVMPGFTEISVLDPRRGRVDVGATRVAIDDPRVATAGLGELTPGTYTVAWRALSAVDGHTTRGVYTFSFGVESETPADEAVVAIRPEALADSVARWLIYLGATALAGACFFRLAVLGPIAAGSSLGGRLLDDYGAAVRRPALIASVVIGLAGMALLISQAIGAAEPTDLASLADAVERLVVGTRYGGMWLARTALALAIAYVAYVAGGGLGRGRDPAFAVGTLFGSLLLLTLSLNSHSAAAGDYSATGVLADWLHLAAVAVWIGGLASLLLVLRLTQGTDSAGQRRDLLAPMVGRFSNLALISVALLILSGIYQSLLHVGAWAALVETAYGWALVTKLLLLVPLLALGAFNLLIVRPRLGQMNDRRAGRDSSSLAVVELNFRRSVTAEVGLGVAILLAAGLLTSVPPAWQAYQQLIRQRPLTLEAAADDLRVKVLVSPGRPGQNTFTAELNQGARPAPNIERVQLRFTYLDQELGTAAENLTPDGDGRHTTTGGFLSVAGRWQLEVLVRRPGLDDARAAFRFDIGAIQPGGAPSPPLPRLPVFTLTTGLALGLMVVGGVLLVIIWRVLGVRNWEGRALAAASIAVVLLGGSVAFRPQPGQALSPTEVRAAVNPFPPTSDSVARGRAIYAQNCAQCHGESGRGDGPLAATSRPRPADFRVHMAAGHTDGELFYWISKGIPGTSMAAFEGQLGEEERWHLVNFIRTFAPVEASHQPARSNG